MVNNNDWLLIDICATLYFILVSKGMLRHINTRG